MFAIDSRIRGIPAGRDQVVGLYQSINQPHLAIPGKAAGPAQAFIVSVRGPSGFAIFVYLFLPDVGDCAVYASDRRNLNAEEFKDEEGEANAFVESMGFMMDDTNFRGLPVDRQEELLRTLPVFQKEPRKAATATAGAAAPPPSSSAAPKPQPAQSAPAAAALGRLFTSF